MSPRVICALGATALVLLAGCGGDDDDGGDARPLGETAVVEYTPTTDSGEKGDPTTLGVTVTAVRKGSQEDLTQGGFEVDEEDRTATPYYVDASFENQGQEPVKKTLDVTLEGPDGESLPSTIVFGSGGKTFKPCPGIQDLPKGVLAPGQSYERCSLVLVPEGTDPETVLFVSQKANDEIVFSRWTAN
jgi:hypothetical protein